MIRATRRAAAAACLLISSLATAAGPPVDLARASGNLSEALRIRTVVVGGEGAARETVEAFRSFLERSYPAAHGVLRRETTPADGTLYTWPGRNPAAAPILLAAHLDVVPAEARDDVPWRHPAFAGVIAKGAVWGRGAIDMKGQLVAIFEALELLAGQGYAPERTILIALGADEEGDGRSAQAIAALLRARGTRAEFVLDEGPMVVDPFPLTGRRAAFIGTAEKGFGTLLVRAAGTGGHSSVPPRRPALVQLSRALLALDRMPLERRLDRHSRAMLAALAPDTRGLQRVAADNLWLFGPIVRGRILKEDAGRALLGTTLAPTMASGSTAENQLPSIATAHVNVRIHPRDAPAQLLAKARLAVAGIPGVTVDWSAPPRPASRYSDLDAEAYRLIRRHVGTLAGENVPVVPILVFGGTDARFYADVADNAYRFQPYILSEQELARIHGADEHLSLANLERAIRFFHGFIGDAAGPRAAAAPQPQ